MSLSWLPKYVGSQSMLACNRSFYLQIICTYLQWDFISVTENALLHSVQLFLDELGWKEKEHKQNDLLNKESI